MLLSRPIITRYWVAPLLGVAIAGSLVVLASCGADTRQRLAGSWQAVSITSDTPLPQDLRVEDFRLAFSADGRYTYSGNLYYREAGHYRLDDSYLYTTDTLRQNAPEKAVQILRLNEDSLIVRMADETVMKMVRTQ